jgi:hypothetical protein
MRASTWAVLRPAGELVERLAASMEVDLHLHSLPVIAPCPNQQDAVNSKIKMKDIFSRNNRKYQHFRDADKMAR